MASVKQSRPSVRATGGPAPAGYSGTPLPKKLGIKPGSVVRIIGAPKGFRKTLGALPEGVELREAGLAAGLVDYKVCAVDAIWSGLLFTRRRGK